jgi:hypothetical protein
MKYEELVEGYKAVVRRIYSHKLYYQRVANFLKTYKPFQNSRVRIHSYDLRAFLKSIWLLGIREKGRFYYWKLIFWSLLTRPRSFPLAVSLAIYGFHFRKIFENY